jgi:dolichol-phosphate mannosyltransferase
MMSLDIVAPVFREEASIATFHAALLEAVAPLAPEYAIRFIYVLDPSPDRTEAILSDLAAADPRITVIVMSRRFGHQAALIAGLDASTGDAVVMLDSDMQHPPSLIPTLVEHWRAGAEIVQTVRRDGQNIAFAKRLTSKIFYRLFEEFSHIEISTGAADFRLLSRRIAEVFRTQLREQNPFFRGLVTWIGYRVVYIPFVPARRAAGRSNYSFSALSAFALNGLFSFSKLPLRVCIVLGFVLGVLSIVGGIALILIYFFIDTTYAPGWATLVALVSFATSMNLFFLGVLGEYIGLIFDEIKNRPRYLIDRTHGTPAPAGAPGGGVPVDGASRAARLIES